MFHRPLPPPKEKFWEALERCPNRVLFLDYDGTLAPFRQNREEAFPYPGVREILGRIVESGRCRTVLITGRWTRDMPALLGLKKLPEIWGSHGVERLLADGQYETLSLKDEQIRGLANADDMVEAAGLTLFREQKPGCLALHWRGADPEIRHRIVEIGEKKLKSLAVRSGLVFKEFDGGLELRIPDRHKGDAVQTVLSEEPDDVYGAYLGDDLTDEDAFRAIEGKGLGILVRESFRPTEAGAWLRPPEELLEFLQRWTNTCR